MTTDRASPAGMTNGTVADDLAVPLWPTVMSSHTSVSSDAFVGSPVEL